MTRQLQPSVWTLATVTDDDPMPNVTLHASYERALAWLRSGWDVDGHFDALDGDGLIDELAAMGSVRASIDEHDRVLDE